MKTSDAHYQQSLRLLGELALRLADGQRIDPEWLAKQFAEAPEDPVLARQRQAVQSAPGSAEDSGVSSLDLLTIPEACNRLRISKWSLYQLIHQRQLETVKIRRRRFVPQAEVRRFISQLSPSGGVR